MAAKELRSLRQRLGALVDRSGVDGWLVDKEAQKQTSSHNITTGKEMVGNDNTVLAGLLVFKQVPATAAALELIIGFQSSVVRCVVGMSKPSAIEVYLLYDFLLSVLHETNTDSRP